MLGIIKKELISYFTNFVNYLIFVPLLFVLYFLSFTNIISTNVANLNPLFSLLPWVLIIFVSALGASIYSKEFENNTYQNLITKPVSELQIILGKMIAANIFFLFIPISFFLSYLNLKNFGDFDFKSNN